MNFLFVDRIFDLKPTISTLGIKHITPSDDYLVHKPGQKPSILSCILGEAIGQLCSWNIIKASDFKLRLVGGIVKEVNIYADAYLGESVILENKIDVLDLQNQVTHFSGIARVGDKKILEVKDGLGPLLPVAEFGDSENVKQQLKVLWRPGELPTPCEFQLTEETFSPKLNPYVNYDRIIHWENNVSVVAEKLISQSAPYFADHFPGRPVLPLSFLLECTLQLGYRFIAASDKLIDINQWQVKQVQRIKMMEFVEPGDIVRTTIKVLDKTPTHISLNFIATVENKRVCVAKAFYEKISNRGQDE
ncbi:MAG: hypothetical protein AAGG80_00025 [Pseudomonadota bacterium]